MTAVVLPTCSHSTSLKSPRTEQCLDGTKFPVCSVRKLPHKVSGKVQINFFYLETMSDIGEQKNSLTLTEDINQEAMLGKNHSHKDKIASNRIIDKKEKEISIRLFGGLDRRLKAVWILRQRDKDIL
ncbi:hypothetical protein AVEN_169100-1 [Araneus ventricosus]|uniref:Uncharacterized protein n=1 Tax=Araneus ventricosus TaxID=182803 RepID=A0A4Y2PR82_ARAVE|nr:hypothetical protein AVEN_169100-1 [Araneus ventricosus]